MEQSATLFLQGLGALHVALARPEQVETASWNAERVPQAEPALPKPAMGRPRLPAPEAKPLRTPAP